MNKYKEKYFKKVYENAPLIECACGCGKLIKSKDKYGRDKFYENGHNGRKYEDKTQYKREWNHRNREKRYQNKRAFVIKRKLQLVEMLGGKCKHCGIQANIDNLAIFDFHHINPSDKSFFLGQNTLGNKKIEDILKEVKKCELLCANCHRLHHYKGEIND